MKRFLLIGIMLLPSIVLFMNTNPNHASAYSKDNCSDSVYECQEFYYSNGDGFADSESIFASKGEIIEYGCNNYGQFQIGFYLIGSDDSQYWESSMTILPTGHSDTQFISAPFTGRYQVAFQSGDSLQGRSEGYCYVRNDWAI